MTKKLTITVSDDVYDGLYRKVGPRRIGRFLEGLARQYVVEADLDAAYREAAQDEEREHQAREWIEGLIGDSFPDEKPRA